MSDVVKLSLICALQGLPVLLIIVASGMYAARERSVPGWMICAGGIVILLRSSMVTLAPLLQEELGGAGFHGLISLFSTLGTLAWYLLGISIAVVLLKEKN